MNNIEKNIVMMKKLLKILIVSLLVIFAFLGFYAFIVSFMNNGEGIKINALFIIVFVVAFFVYVINSFMVAFRYIVNTLEKDATAIRYKVLFRFWIATNATTLYLLSNSDKYGILGLVMLIILFALTLIVYKQYNNIL